MGRIEETGFFVVESHELAYDAIAFVAICPYLMIEMPRNLIKMRSCSIFIWFNTLNMFSRYL